MQKHQQDEKEYEVEAIIGKRAVNHRVQYKVKWKGYSRLKATWEPKRHLAKARKLLRDYNALIANKKNSVYHKVKKTSADPSTINVIEPRNSQRMRSAKVISETKEDPEVKVAPEAEASDKIKPYLVSETNQLVFRIPPQYKTIELRPTIVIHVGDENCDEGSITRVVNVKMRGNEFVVYAEKENSRKEVSKVCPMTITEFKKLHSDILIDYFIKELREKEKNDAKKTENDLEKEEDMTMELGNEKKKEVKSNKNDNMGS